MEYPIEVPLKRPITVDGKTIDKLVFDEPDLGTSIAVEEAKSPAEQTAILLAGMAGIDCSVMLKVKESDFREIGKRVLEPYQAHIAAQQKDDAGNAQAAK
ncbi:phage tail assembly protein [Antarcticimicrobium sediminis]|uniref:Phage tail assembly protein n=1 Tax=Antarcticimicrobium sediminis TaxID=2546227 RepID=A0A4R5EHY0_9RHOB|nr:phage tail assembly protein [Antarcticimicrobium sediminis]TDE34115.1 phage tail assembly protein [Antarcticimicrobium sediminis]